jgi:hypothetical protein
MEKILRSFFCLLFFVSALMSPADCGYDYFDVQFLYWKSHEEGIPFAAGGTMLDTTVVPPPGRVREVDFRFDPGFRVGAGHVFDCNEWDLSLTYTWFRGKARGSLFDPTFGTLGIWSAHELLVGLAKAKWDLRLETLELLLGRPFCTGTGLVLGPFFGVEGAHTRETYHLRYVSTAESDLVKNKQKLWGVGPKIGFDSRWQFCQNLGLFAQAGFALLWAHTHVSRFEFSIPVAAPTVILVDMRERFHALRFVIDYCFGLSWENNICVCGCEYPYALVVAWEQQKWVNHNQMFYGPVNPIALVLNRNSDLNFYGLTVKAQLLF